MSSVVEVQQGKLVGKENISVLNAKKYYSFVGIPYAKPPLGDLRFRAPVPAEKWQQTIFEATSGSPDCIQVDAHSKNGLIIGSEDCLYLNINTPEDPAGIKVPKAVMVFVHGGGFQFGSGSDRFYSADYLINQDVILVTINYRLHVLGFLNLDIPECPGNVGLKDQALALKWVKENIKQFGGDPDNITIFGESAGATSVHFQILSPLTKGLFNKAILQSGSALAPWALNHNKEGATKELGEKLKFPGGSKLEFLNFLKKQNAEELTRAVKSIRDDFIKRYPSRCTTVSFNPTVEEIKEGAFIPDLPEKLVKACSPMPVIYGVTDAEGILSCSSFKIGGLNELKDDFSIILKNNFKIDPALIPDLSSKVRQQYFGDKEIKLGDELFDLYSDLYFYRFYDAIEPIASSSTPVYVYEFNYAGGSNLYKKLMTEDIEVVAKGACHADDLSYLFRHKFLDDTSPPTGDDLTVIETMTLLWANFAKFGNPQNDSWKPSTPHDPCYLRINTLPTLIKGKIYEKRLQFLKNLLHPVAKPYDIF